MSKLVYTWVISHFLPNAGSQRKIGSYAREREPPMKDLPRKSERDQGAPSRDRSSSQDLSHRGAPHHSPVVRDRYGRRIERCNAPGHLLQAVC